MPCRHIVEQGNSRAFQWAQPEQGREERSLGTHLTEKGKTACVEKRMRMEFTTVMGLRVKGGRGILKQLSEKEREEV